MSKFCRSCGKEIDGDSEFCEYCGTKVNKDTNDNNDTKVNDNPKTNNDFLVKLPLILAIISILLAIAEVLFTPVIMGYDSIMISGLIAVIGGIIGIYLMEKLNEPLVAAIDFIAVAVVIFMFIGRFGEISVILFIITAILSLYVKGTHVNNRKLFAIPILMVVLLLLILIIGGVAYNINAENSVKVGNITQDSKFSYNYWNTHVKGDIHIDTSFDYLCVNVNFYDQQNKIIHNTIGWNDIHPQSGKTYTFDGFYFGQTQPVKAELIVTDKSDSSHILYTQNVTLN